MFFPAELRDVPQWVLCVDKRPVSPNGSLAKWSDPRSWMTYHQACGLQGDFNLGFVLTKDDPFVCIDLDKAIDDDGEVADWAMQITEPFADTYAEISQSGHGIHIFLKASDRLYGRRGSKVACGTGALEVYSRDRFIQLTGTEFAGQVGVTWQQVAFDALVDKYLSPLAAAPARQGWQDVVTDVSMEDRVRAAIKLAMEHPAAVSGQGGHATTFDLARDVVRGCCVDSEARAMQVMQLYNSLRCVPPWSDAELLHKIQQARTATSPEVGLYLGAIGRFLGEVPPPIQPAPPVELPAVEESFDDVEAGELPPWEDGFERPGGILNELLDTVLAVPNVPQVEIALPACLMFLSALASSSYEDETGGFATNLFFIALGPTASGKTSNVTPLEDLGQLLGLGNQFRVQAGAAGSTAGLYQMLTETPSAGMALDEFHRLLPASGQRGPHQGILDTLKALFNEQRCHRADIYADTTKNREVNFANFSFMGLTVAEEFWKTTTSSVVSDGFLNRCMLVEIQDPFKTAKPRGKMSPSNRLMSALEFLRNRPKRPSAPPLPLRWTTEARERFDSYGNAVREKHPAESEENRSVWARSPEKVSRLSRLLAISDSREQPVVTAGHVQWAIRFVNYCHRLMVCRLPLVGTTDFVRDQDRILGLLDNAPGKRMLHSRLSNRMRVADDERNRLDKLLSALQRRGLVEVVAGKARNGVIASTIQLCEKSGA